jgi:DUF1365 family protein
MHVRLTPVRHYFTRRVFSILVDIDRLAEANRLSPLLSINGFNLLSFHERDHGARDGGSLRAHINKVLAEAGIDPAGLMVRLLTFPRVCGYVFNPLSVYWCSDPAGRMVAIIHEVRNTIGGIHAYVVPIAQHAAPGLAHQRDKTFYVSPFLPMDMRYDFRLRAPGASVGVQITVCRDDKPLLVATLHSRRQALTTRSIIAACLRLPFMTLRVILAIHGQAFALWRKGVPIVPKQ